MVRPKTNKQLLQEVIQRLDVMDQRMALLEQLINNLRPVQPNMTNLPPPMYFSSNDEPNGDFENFMEFINRMFDKEFGL
tara:strand:+ start:856 stop:1092 length:237 start_codon:yes stop_codon:yes gene_type:complete